MASDASLPIGVVVGLAAEARIARRTGWAVAIGGGSAAGAAAAAQRLVDQGARMLVSFGLAGGLDPSLRPGAIVRPAIVLADGTRYVVDAALALRLGGAPAGVLFGGDAVIGTAEAKRQLHAQTQAAAVDLESGAVAEAATRHGLPFAVLRAVCDPAERSLPPVALIALDRQGRITPWRVLAALAAEPSQLRALLALAADARAARRALVRTVLCLRASQPAATTRVPQQ